MARHDYTLTFEDRGQYLYAHLTGTDSYAASLSYWNEISDEVRKFDFRRLLVHENLIGHVNEGEVFDIICDLVPSGLGIKVAFYDENRADADINELGLLIASNRGIDVRMFSSLEDAEKWISSSA